MIFTVATHKASISIELNISVFSGQVAVVGYNHKKDKTEYFNLLVNQGERQKYSIALPASPNKLEILVFEVDEGNRNTSGKFKINSITVQKLKLKALLLDDKTKEFVLFMNEFTEKAGHISKGIYESRNKNFVINLYDDIPGNKSTPSRVHMGDGVIDVSKKWFDNMTIPGRKAILTHEFAHKYLNDERINKENNDAIEQDADNEALKLYLALGNPKFEWMYAWTHIFENHASHFARLDNSIGKLKQID